MTHEEQIERFRKGFSWLDIAAPASVGNGIESLSEEQMAEAAAYSDEADVKGRCKFVPASGAASRMFKKVFAADSAALTTLAGGIEKFAFYSPEVFGSAPYDPQLCADRLLLSDGGGLGYGSKPKGVLKFHRYADEVRTALAEHLVEGQAYMRDTDGIVRLVFTISPEHRSLFEDALAEVKPVYEERYGVHYDVRFTYQDKSTDTIAVDPDNRPFLKEDGTVLTRPAGHGALIYNLNEVDAELVSIKNVDNVAVERLLPVTAKYKKALMGRALQLRDRIFGYIYALDQVASAQAVGALSPLPFYNSLQDDIYASDEVQELCNEIETFLADTLCIQMPPAHDCRSRAEALREKLDRPIRVCGMVRNQGEPGGGPFIVRASDGSTSLQILEGAQINPADPAAQKALQSATHFNPVDLVCCLLNSEGERFNLPAFVDPETGFISSKSYQGRELKALELPGLWNGAMSDWNTLFVEVPVETFNPVKEVFDLLRPAHQN